MVKLRSTMNRPGTSSLKRVPGIGRGGRRCEGGGMTKVAKQYKESSLTQKLDSHL